MTGGGGGNDGRETAGMTGRGDGNDGKETAGMTEGLTVRQPAQKPGLDLEEIIALEKQRISTFLVYLLKLSRFYEIPQIRLNALAGSNSSRIS